MRPQPARLGIVSVFWLVLACTPPEERARDVLGQVRQAFDGTAPNAAALVGLGVELDRLVPELERSLDDTRREVASEANDAVRSERSRAILAWLLPDTSAADTAERAFFGRLLESVPGVVHAGPNAHDESPLDVLRRLSERRSAATTLTARGLEEGLARLDEPQLPARVSDSAARACACHDRACLLASREALRALTTQTLRYTSPEVRAAIDTDLQRWRGCVKALTRDELERAPLD
ncbi:MAG: hypothetical protein IV100_17275 [Myxococcales bacterium]|nr:hypothetical protein [Myxococcales bacterium]